MEDELLNPVGESESPVVPQDSFSNGEGERLGESKETIISHNEPDLLPAALELLRRLSEPEPIPAGVISSGKTTTVPDLYTLLEAMIALRQEISLQGRSFHRLEQVIQQSLSFWDFLPSLDERVASFHSDLDRLQSFVESVSSQTLAEERKRGQKAGRERAIAFLIEPLLDTHDQLRRWLEQNQLRPPKPHRWRRWFTPTDPLADLVQTIILSQKKLTQRLSALGISPIAQVDMEFDPATMKAVDRIESHTGSANTVLEIYRQGYRSEDRVLRFAEVKVSCPKTDEVIKS